VEEGIYIEIFVKTFLFVNYLNYTIYNWECKHEVDHLDGVLFIDKITDWDRIEVMPLALHYPGVVELLKEHDR